MTTWPAGHIDLHLPLVSVVVPCFGEGRYLDDCLRSIRRQTHRHLEIIVIDDGGTDDSVAVATEHALADRRVTVLRTEANVGLGAIRNIGLRQARGDLVTFVDGDDLLPIDSIGRRVDALASALDAGEIPPDRIAGVYGDWIYTAASIHHVASAPAGRPLVPIDLRSSGGGNVFIVSAPLVRCEVMRETGGFAQAVTGGEDYLAWLRILCDGGIFVPCHHLVAAYRQKPSSMVRTSAGEYAALAAGGRGLLASTTELPLAPGSALDGVETGEHLIEFGTIVEPHPTLAAVAAVVPTTEWRRRGWAATPPAGPDPDSPVGARMTAARALLDDPEPLPTTAVLRFTRVNTGLSIALARTTDVPDALVADPGGRVHLRADTWFGGAIAACVASVARSLALAAELTLSPAARRGALQLLTATSMPDVLLLAAAVSDASPATSEGVRLTTEDDRCVVPLAPARPPDLDSIDAWELVRQHLAVLRPGRSIGGLEVVGAHGLTNGHLGRVRARSLQDDAGDSDEIRLLAASCSEVARQLADAAVQVPVVTMGMVVGAREVITDDPDVALLSAALGTTVRFSGPERALPFDLSPVPGPAGLPGGGAALRTFLATATPSTHQPTNTLRSEPPGTR